MAGSANGAGLLRIRCSNSLYGWHSRAIWWKLFAYAGSLPGFRRTMILVLLQLFGVFLVSLQLFMLKDQLPCQRSKVLDLFYENIVQADGFASLKGL